MLFRYRCRNYPDTLFMHEIERWNQYRIQRMTEPQGSASIKLDEYKTVLSQLRQEEKKETIFAEEKKRLFDELEAYPALIGIDSIAK